MIQTGPDIFKMYLKMMMIPSLSKVPHWVGSDEGRCGAGWGRPNYVQAGCGEGGYDWYGDVDVDAGDRPKDVQAGCGEGGYLWLILWWWSDEYDGIWTIL